MNIRSLTRGDGVVIGAAVLLFIASFLDFYSVDCEGEFCNSDDIPSAWESELFPVLPSVFLAGIIAAALVVASRFLPAGRKLVGLSLDQWGTALAVFSAWSALWVLFDGPLRSAEQVSLGLAPILAFLATLALAAGAVLGQTLPALKAPLLGAPKPPAPSPYGAGPGQGYGYPGAQQPGYGYPVRRPRRSTA
ncbi:hypothetical protein AB0C60_14740, partial [Streptomyces sp. NPDC048845]